MPELDPAALLAAYHDQLRTEDHEPLPTGWRLERDGPVTRMFMGRSGFVSYRSVAHLSPDELDALIARQRDIFAALGQEVEWKWRAYDQPADLPDRLRAAGFQPQERETVVVGLAEPLTALDAPPEVRLRAVTARADLDRIAAMETEVWGEDRGWLAEALEAELEAAPESLTILVAEADRTAEVDGIVVSAGWVRYVAGTDFAGLWGGSTLKAWRRKGIYRALVGARARLALDRGYRYLQVDASDDSRPILERLGFVALTETVPYVFNPAVFNPAQPGSAG